MLFRSLRRRFIPPERNDDQSDERRHVPTQPILQALRDTGYQGWICTELDAWADPAEGARLSMNYLKTH